MPLRSPMRVRDLARPSRDRAPWGMPGRVWLISTDERPVLKSRRSFPEHFEDASAAIRRLNHVRLDSVAPAQICCAVEVNAIPGIAGQQFSVWS
jgi:hypothetical protein